MRHEQKSNSFNKNLYVRFLTVGKLDEPVICVGRAGLDTNGGLLAIGLYVEITLWPAEIWNNWPFWPGEIQLILNYLQTLLSELQILAS